MAILQSRALSGYSVFLTTQSIFLHRDFHAYFLMAVISMCISLSTVINFARSWKGGIGKGQKGHCKVLGEMRLSAKKQTSRFS